MLNGGKDGNNAGLRKPFDEGTQEERNKKKEGDDDDDEEEMEDDAEENDDGGEPLPRHVAKTVHLSWTVESLAARRKEDMQGHIRSWPAIQRIADVIKFAEIAGEHFHDWLSGLQCGECVAWDSFARFGDSQQ